MLGISISTGFLTAAWAVAAVWIFSGMKRSYEAGGVLPRRLLAGWFGMWGCHHLAVVLAALHRSWPLPLAERAARSTGASMAVFGIIVLVVAMAQFRSLRRSCGQNTSELVSSGIYRWSRNPQFVGWGLILLGVAVAGRSGAALSLVVAFALVVHGYTVWLEEPYLERIFGDTYRRYRSRTARYIGSRAR